MSDVLALTAQIATAYVSHNAVEAAAVAPLLRSIQDTVTDLEAGGLPAPRSGVSRALVALDVVAPVPRVPAQESVFKQHIVCMICAGKFRTMKRHLRETHKLTTNDYRLQFDLPDTYPLMAPAYAVIRSDMAKARGLGRRAGRPATVPPMRKSQAKVGRKAATG